MSKIANSVFQIQEQLILGEKSLEDLSREFDVCIETIKRLAESL
jgi:hypothetical protein